MQYAESVVDLIGGTPLVRLTQVTRDLGPDAPLVLAKDPPVSLTASDGTGLRVVAFTARAVIEDPLCFTELRLTFQKGSAAQRAALLTFLGHRAGDALSADARKNDYRLRVQLPALILGGPHHQLQGTANLDGMSAQLGITKGQDYPMDIFHAERHTDASHFNVSTTIKCFVPIPPK